MSGKGFFYFYSVETGFVQPLLVMMFRTAEFLRPRDLSCEFLRSMDQDRKALGANPDLSTHELQCK